MQSRQKSIKLLKSGQRSARLVALNTRAMPLHFLSTRTVQPFVAHSSNVNCLALGRKSAGVLVTGGEDSLINVWRLGRPAALLNLSGHASPITCVDFDHREEMVTGGSFGGSLKVFDLSAHGKVVRTYQGHHTAVVSIDHHPYGGHVVSGSTDSTVRLWDLRRKTCRSTFKGHQGALTCVRFSPDGSQVASGSDDGRIKIWDLTAGKLLQEFQHKGVQSIEYHPNDFLMCSVGKDRCIKMWDVDRMELVETSTKQSSNASCVRFDREGKGLLTTSGSTLRSWKWEPMRVIDSLASTSWGDDVKDMRTTSTRQNQVVVCSSTDSFVSAWVINMGEEEEKEEGGEKRGGERGDGKRRSGKSTSAAAAEEQRRRREVAEREKRDTHSRSSSSRRRRNTSLTPPRQQQQLQRAVQEVSPTVSPAVSPSVAARDRAASPLVQRTPPRKKERSHRENKVDREKEDQEEHEERRRRRLQREEREEREARAIKASSKLSREKEEPPRTSHRLTHSPVVSPAPSPANSPRRRSSPASSATTTTTTTTTIITESKGCDAATSMGSSFFKKNDQLNLAKLKSSMLPITLPGSKYEDEASHLATRGLVPSSSSSSSTADLAAISKLRRDGKRLRQDLSARLRELRVVQSLWSGSSRTGGSDALSHVQKSHRDDPSIALDFVTTTRMDGGAFDLSSCVTLFPLLSSLLSEHQRTEEHALRLMHSIQTLYRGFGEVICHNARKDISEEDGRRRHHNPFAKDVDIGSEERVHRATTCYVNLKNIAGQVAVLMQETTSTQVKRAAQELHRLFRKKGIGS